MHIILGGTGHVGSAAVEALLERGAPVTVITRDGSKAEPAKRQGAAVAVADIHDVDALRAVFRRGKRLFLLNPPADPSTDVDAEERRTVAAILAALQGSGLEKVVAHSTYGAQPGKRCGDLAVLYEMEQALRDQSIPVSTIRAAYYMSNWDTALESADKEGVVHSFFPEDFELAMVAPQDLGQFAARLLVEPAAQTGLHHVEGPKRYTPRDVAAAFAKALRKPVRPVVVPREAWQATFKQIGFSDVAAESYACMTDATLSGKYQVPKNPERGKVSLEQYVAALVARPKRDANK